jgi:hypothetical protein
MTCAVVESVLLHVDDPLFRHKHKQCSNLQRMGHLFQFDYADTFAVGYVCDEYISENRAETLHLRNRLGVLLWLFRLFLDYGKNSMRCELLIQAEKGMIRVKLTCH